VNVDRSSYLDPLFSWFGLVSFGLVLVLVLV
jgi:hypothetical protein